MIIGIIPARMASTRFFGKPLAKISSKVMICYVYFRSKLCRKLNDLYITIPDNETKGYCIKSKNYLVPIESIAG